MSNNQPMTLDPIVSQAWLAHAWDQPNLVLCDVRYYLDGRSGPDAFESGHLPGARYIDMDTVLASPGGPVVGRHPMPTPETFAAGLAAAGVRSDADVVVYDDSGGQVAGRLVWMLRILGQSAGLLDGGVHAWSGQLETGPVNPDAVTRKAEPWPADAMVDADGVVEAVEAGRVVVDSRAGERYRGETEPIDPRAGHVPGAINLPFGGNLDADGCFLPIDQLRARFEEAGLDGNGVVYCGSGVSACNNLLAVEAAGLGRPTLYVGSWSGWSTDPDRPAAVG